MNTEQVNESVKIEKPDQEAVKKGEAAIKKAAARVPEMPFDPMDAVNAVSHGKLTLAEPIMDGDDEYTELVYDFKALKGLEMARALDFGDGPKDSFKISDVQALNFFACAAAKCQSAGGLDAKDIRERISGMDAIKAIQIATAFFVFSSRAGDRRLSKE